MPINPLIVRFDSLPSTNTEAARQASLGAPEGLCVIAREQTAGRGRERRIWLSPRDAGLYLSIVLRPEGEVRYWPLITLMASVAIHDTLESAFGVDCDIKWPNDIHCEGRKICGVLAETVETPSGQGLILGIGINLTRSALPPELETLATSIEEQTGVAPDTATLIGRLMQKLSFFYDSMQSPNGPAIITAEWSKRSSYTEGKRVRVTFAQESIEGVTRGLETDGALRIEIDTGAIKVVHSGDVTGVRSVINSETG
jgi:BirA family biotin operon repressor/biotin-[acetyl-CoA-carboxylase] ligase